MEIVMWSFVVVGGTLAVIGSFWLLLAAFEESAWWGLACLIIPVAPLIFVPLYWKRAGTPFLVTLVGSIIVYGTMAMFGNF